MILLSFGVEPPQPIADYLRHSALALAAATGALAAAAAVVVVVDVVVGRRQALEST
jgi:hypothetical protein